MRLDPVRVVADPERTDTLVQSIADREVDQEMVLKGTIATLVTRFNMKEADARRMLGL